MADNSRIIAVKIGGKAASQEEAMRALVRETVSRSGRERFVLVHGGGAEVSRITRVFGLEPVFVNGKRMTSPAEMEIVEMVLAGKMNKSIVRLFQSMGVRAAGLCGSDGAVFTGESLEGTKPDATRTGAITGVDTALLRLLLDGGYLPVIASTSMDAAGGALNINADEAAFRIASALPAAALVFLSDIPGILKDGEVLRSLTAEDARREIENGTISGGMIPKVESSLEALSEGVDRIIIGEYRKPGDLEALLSGAEGTSIRKS
jgi:acetylglutamate kinase